MSYTKANINDLEVNGAWIEIQERVERMLETNDKKRDNPDSFEHGKAVGEKDTLRFLRGIVAELRRIAESPTKSAETSLRPR